MRIQKNIAIFSGIVAILALGISFFFKENTYISSILIGLFSSGILVCAVSIITFWGERNKAVLALYNGCYDFSRSLTGTTRPNNMIAINEVKEDLAIMRDTYMKHVYLYVCQLMILPKRSGLRKIVEEMWDSAKALYMLVVEDENMLTQFYIEDITLEEISGYKWKHVSADAAQYMDHLHDALDKLMYHMNYYNVRKEKKSEVSENAD